MKWLLVILGVSCACHTAPRYEIKGKLANYSGKVFLLTSGLEKKCDTLASAEVKKGVFEMRGSVREPVVAWILTEKGDLKVPVFLENTSFSLEGDINQPKNYVFTGGRLQDLREQFRKEVEDSIRVREVALQKEYREAAAEDNLFGVMHVRAKMADLDSVYERKENAFLRENNNIVSASLIRGRLNELLQRKKLREKFGLLGDTARNSFIGKELTYYLEREQSTAIGAIAPDFTMNTPEGKPVSLHAVKAKVKILDFWASWCAPCRAKNKELNKHYQELKDLGVNVVSVSLDNDRKKWVKAMEEDQVAWLQLVDLDGFEKSKVRADYKVSGVPTVYLIDPEGNVLITGPSLEEIKNAIK